MDQNVNKEICRTEEECWELAEECRKRNKKEYSLPIPLTTEQKQQMIEAMFKK